MESGDLEAPVGQGQAAEVGTRGVLREQLEPDERLVGVRVRGVRLVGRDVVPRPVQLARPLGGDVAGHRQLHARHRQRGDLVAALLVGGLLAGGLVRFLLVRPLAELRERRAQQLLADVVLGLPLGRIGRGRGAVPLAAVRRQHLSGLGRSPLLEAVSYTHVSSSPPRPWQHSTPLAPDAATAVRRAPSVLFCGPGFIQGGRRDTGARSRLHAACARACHGAAAAHAHPPRPHRPAGARRGRPEADAGHAGPGRLPDRRPRHVELAPPDPTSSSGSATALPIPGATAQDYLVQVADVGHTVAPQVTGHAGPGYTSTDLRRDRGPGPQDRRHAHPRRSARPPGPGRMRLVWMAISFMTTERPWAHRRRHRGWRTRRRTAGSRSSAARSCPRRGVRPAAVEARAIGEHLA